MDAFLPGLLDSASAESVLRGAFGVPGASSLAILARANDLKVPSYIVNAGNIDAVLQKLPPETAAILEPSLRLAVRSGQTAVIPGASLTMGGWL